MYKYIIPPIRDKKDSTSQGKFQYLLNKKDPNSIQISFCPRVTILNQTNKGPVDFFPYWHAI